jgi:trimethylamine--corrinoid protein Co-methyltransferase
MRFQILSDEEIETIHAASAWVLAERGLRFLNHKALQVFAEAGASVNFEQQLVRIPGALLEQALAAASGHFRLWDRDGMTEIDLQDGRTRGHNVGGCVRVFDALSNRPRPASRPDLEQMVILLDALEHIDVCRPIVYPAEFPQSMWDIFTAATMMQFTTKPYGFSAYSPANLEIILDLCSVIAGSRTQLVERPFVWGSICPESPLSYSNNTTEILIRYAELGLPLAIAPCPVSGGTSPVTLAGTLVQINAEFLAGFVLAQILHRGIDVKYTGRPLPMNLRTGNATFGSVEIGLMSAALVQLARRYRVCSDVYGLGTRSRRLDEQAAFEKALSGLIVGLAGADLVAAAGLLDDALTSSPEQLVIDDELLGMILRSGRGITVNPATLALEAIQRVGPGGNYLTDEHTLQFLRQEHYLPRLVYQRNHSPEAHDEGSLLEAAQARARAILQSHAPPLPDAAARAEIESILNQARQSEEY